MKTSIRAFGGLIGALVLALTLTMPAYAYEDAKVNEVLADAAEYIAVTVKEPQVGSIGGEWAVLGLARSGYNAPQNYFENYYQSLEKYVKDCGGVLHERKYTEYSRVIVALSAIGKDPANVGGYNLLQPLGDYDNTVWQGLNGPIWALIALDSGNYAMPQNPAAKTQASREMYLQAILEAQLADGGWALSGKTAAAADVDMTGMALQALSNYQEQAEVKAATDKALAWLSSVQDAQGGFSSWGEANSESVVQVIVALTSLDIPLDDSRFVKGGHSLLENMLSFYQPGKGFLHVQSGGGNSLMSSEQGLYAMAAIKRANAGQTSLYDMSDVTKQTAAKPAAEQKPEPTATKQSTNTAQSNTVQFADLAGVSAEAKAAIEALAAKGIITGECSEQPGAVVNFRPAGSMTRAEFCAIVVRALDLETAQTGVFADVQADAWYAAYVDTANAKGIVNGAAANAFEPDSTITRQEAAAMVARAAALAGLTNELDANAARDILAQFGDYVQIADYARLPMAFCYQQGILDDSALNVEPAKVINRAEIAQMLYNMLTAADRI